MKLQKAFEMRVNYLGVNETIRVNEDGYICLTDLNKYYPKKRIRDWEALKATKEFIETVSSFLNSENSRSLDLIKKQRGRYDGGTYAHELIAFEFATWLSPEFKLQVFLEYQNGTQRKEDWNIKRILASHNYKIMTKAIEQDHENPQNYHYSNEAIMINKIVFGKHEKGIRDSASEYDLDRIANLESHNSTMIYLGMNFKTRKENLANISYKETLADFKNRANKEVING